jgi:hypothetical protein
LQTQRLKKFIVRAGTSVDSIAPTHLDADVPLTIGPVCMQDNTPWVDFDDVDTDMSPVLDTMAIVLPAPADESTTPPMWKIQTDSEVNSDLDAQQRTRLGEFIISAAIGFPATTYVFSTSNDLGRANEKWPNQLHVIVSEYPTSNRCDEHDGRTNVIRVNCTVAEVPRIGG